MARAESGLQGLLALADYASGAVATEIFQYVADYLIEGRASPGEAEFNSGLALLRRLLPEASPASKAKVAARLRHPSRGRVELLLLLLEDAAAEVWEPLLRSVRLEEAEWLTLLPRAPLPARRLVAGRTDLPLRVRRFTGGGAQARAASPLRPEVFYPARVVEEALAALADHARRQGLSLAGAVEPGMPPVVGNPALLAQALARLARRACDAARPGDRLDIGVRRAGGGGLAYTLTRPAALSPAAARSLVASLVEALGGDMVAAERQFVLFFRLPPAPPLRPV